MFEETQIQPDLVLKRDARYEKRNFELETIHKEHEELAKTADQSKDILIKITQENERLKSLFFNILNYFINYFLFFFLLRSTCSR